MGFCLFLSCIRHGTKLNKDKQTPICKVLYGSMATIPTIHCKKESLRTEENPNGLQGNQSRVCTPPPLTKSVCPLTHCDTGAAK